DLVKYEFKNEINVTDLGLRLADVEKYGLKSEWFEFKGQFPPDTIATEQEQEFLQSNRRVELNAFTAPQFIEWLEGKLEENGLKQRLIPSDDVLAAAYRRALVIAELNQAIEEAYDQAVEKADAAKVPESLRGQLQEALKDRRRPWDEALYEIAEKNLDADEDDDD